MSLSEKIVDYALGLTFSDLPDEVILEAKRCLLDTLGCAIVGYPSECGEIAIRVFSKLGGAEESTVIGSGERLPCHNATLVNGIMLRYSEFMDTYHSGPYRTQKDLRGGHFSEIIPAILATGELGHVSGEEVITAIVLGYELLARFVHAKLPGGGGFVVPLVVGKLLGLNNIQMKNAMGISGYHNVYNLGVTDAAEEQEDMTKNTRFPFVAQNGVMAALMAKEGYTGPRALEGSKGLIDTEMARTSDINLEELTAFPEMLNDYTILSMDRKEYPVDYSSVGSVSATVKLVKEHKFSPEDIKEVKVRPCLRCAGHTGNLAKLYPKNKETADHSLYYAVARTILDKTLYVPDQFTEEKLTSPEVHELQSKIVVDGDPYMFCPGATVSVLTKVGKNYSSRVDYPKGDHRNPMTDEELINKFRINVSKLIREPQTKKLIQTIYDLNSIDNLDRLVKLLVFKWR